MRPAILLCIYCALAVAGRNRELFGQQLRRAPDEAGRRGVGDAYLPVPIDDNAPMGNGGLFIGVNRFDDPSLRPLRFAVHDAIEQAYLFVVELKLIPPKNCFIALSGTPSSRAIEQHLTALKLLGVHVGMADGNAILDDLSNLVEASDKNVDMMIVSVCSHGFDKKGVAYVMPSDGRLGRLDRTGLSLTAIELEMEKAKRVRCRLLIVDACQERILNDGTRGASSLRGSGMSDDFAAALEQSSGQGKFASCSRGQASHESYQLGNVGHGVFSFALLEALRGGARPDAQNLVRLGSVIQYVDQRVNKWIADQNQVRRKDDPEVFQSPSWHGPEELRAMPLAQRGGELDVLIAELRQQVNPSQFTSSQCDMLVTWLTSNDLTSSHNREMLLDIRRFAAKELPPRLFVPYISQKLAGQPIRLQGPFTAVEAEDARDAWAEQQNRDTSLKNSIGMAFALIPAGEFLMGSDEDETRRDEDEFQHPVRLTRPYYLGKHEVTQAEYQRVMGVKPGYFSPEGDGFGKVAGIDTLRFPVESVSWNDAVDFCGRLSLLSAEQAAGRTYRLPTEAEWEFACLAVGNERQPPPLANRAWYRDNARGRVHAVGTLSANGFGLHDMLGNVSEWCQDWYHSTYYRASPIDDPGGPSRPTGEIRKVLRGGSWLDSDRLCRPAYRTRDDPESRHNTDGFRVVMEIALRP